MSRPTRLRCHAPHGARERRTGHQRPAAPRRRGFTTLETVIALSIFLAVAASVAATSVQVAATLARTELKQDVLAAMDRDLELLARGSFDDLAGEQFDAPNRCGEAGARRQQSCEDLNGRRFTISYTTTLVADDAAGPTPSASQVSLTATTALPDGTTVSRNRKVATSALGLTADTAVVRVRSLSDDDADQLPVVLLDRNNNAAAPPVPFQDGLALVKVPGDACSGPDGPCHLGISTDDEYWTAGDRALSPADVLGPAGRLALTPGSFSELSVRIGPAASATVRLLAQGALGPTSSPPAAAAGTVCLWGTFSDGTARRSAPFCNDEDPSQVVLDGFTDPASGRRYPFPDGFQLSLTLDAPDGGCPGATSFPPGVPPRGVAVLAAPLSATAADVCTSWTWGTPTRFGPRGATTATPLPRDVEVTRDGARYDLVWTESSRAQSNVSWRQVSVGPRAACATTATNQLWCWGSNATGVTGLGTTSGVTSAPNRVGADANWAQVSVGSDHACAVRTDGTLWCWGSSAVSANGLDPTTVATVPAQVGTDTDWVDVAAGAEFTCGHRGNQVHCFGRDQAGQQRPHDVSGGTVDAFTTGTGTAPTGVAAGPDGSLWVTLTGTDRLARYSTSGAQLASYATGSQPASPVVGPDGNVWVAEPGDNTVSRFTPTGTRTAFPLSSAVPSSVKVRELAAGPGGKVWFTAANPVSGDGRVGYVAADGAVSAATVAGGPRGITLGADGQGWFTTETGHKLGYADASGAVTLRSTTLSSPRDVVGSPGLDADDAGGPLWVTEPGSLAVSRLTEAGARTGQASVSPRTPQLAAWADGSLLVSSSTASPAVGQVLRVRHPGSGAPSVADLLGSTSSGDTVGGVAVGADGNVWFTGTTLGRLYRHSAATAYGGTTQLSLAGGQPSVSTPLAVGPATACLSGPVGSKVSCWGAAVPSQGPRTTASSTVTGALAAGSVSSGAVDAGLSVGARHACQLSHDGVLGCWGSDRDGQLGAVPPGATTAPVPVPSAASVPGAAGPDGRLWSATTGAAVATDPVSGTSTSYPAGTQAGSVAAGPDGAMWYATAGGKLGRVTTTGEDTPVDFGGTAGDALSSLVVGPDGAMWFAAPESKAVGRVTTSGAVTLYPTGDDRPVGVAPGPGGKLWVVFRDDRTQVASVTTTGGVNRVALSSPLTGDPLAVGSDGDRLYVAASGGAAPVAVVAADGTVAGGAAGGATGTTGAVVAAPSGQVWWRVGTKVGTVTPAAATTVVATVSGAGLAVGPSGDVWAGGTGVMWRLEPGASGPQTVDGTWTAVSAGQRATCGVRQGGTLWCWGDDADGQLGVTGTSVRTAPARVGSRDDWSQVSSSWGSPTACATTTSGQLWCWGSNANGLTGLGTAAGTTSSPARVVALSGTAGRATPATGYGSVGPWSKARDAALAFDGTGFASGCATDANTATRCLSVADQVPEAFPGTPATCLVSLFCLSRVDAPARLVSPAPGTGVRPSGAVVAGTAVQVPVAFADPEGDEVRWRLAAAPGAGTLSLSQGGATLGTSSWQTVASGSTTGVWFTPSTSFAGLTTFQVEVTTAAQAAAGVPSVTEEVAVYRDAAPLAVTADAVTAAQGSTGNEVTVRVTRTDGTPAAGERLSAAASDPTLALAPGFATTDADGTATFQLNVGAAAAAVHTVVVSTSNLRTATVPVTVTATVGSVALSGATLAQGGTTATQLTALDRAGAPVDGASVRVWVTRASATSALVRPTSGVCVTQAGGTCPFTVAAAPTAAAAADYVLHAEAGTGSATAAVQVTLAATQLEAVSGRSAPEFASQFQALVDQEAAGDDGLPVRLPLSDAAGGAGEYTGPTQATGSTPGVLTRATLGGDPLGGPAPAYGSVGFDGDGRVCTSGPATLGSSFTLEGWFRPARFASGGSTWLLGGEGGPHLELAAAADGTESVPTFVVPGSPRRTVAGPALTAGQPVHLVAVLSPARMQLFVDGVLAASDPVPTGFTSFTGTVCAAGWSGMGGTDHGLVGWAGFAMVHRRALGAATVARLHSLGGALAAAAGAGEVAVDQGGTATVAVTARSADGTAVPGVQVVPPSAATLDGWGLQLTPASAATTDASGRATFQLRASTNAPADEGLRRLRFTATGANVTLRDDLLVLAEVRSTADTVEVPTNGVTVAQGARSVVEVTVRDGAGDLAAGVVVSATLSGTVDGVRVGARATTGSGTSDRGVARIPVTVEPDVDTATTGLQVTVRAGAAAPRSFPLSITAGAGRVRSLSEGSVPQGGSGGWTVEVTDAAGRGVAGKTVTASCAGCGLEFSAAATTDGAGNAAFTVTDAVAPDGSGRALPGTYPATATIDGREYRVTVRVRSAAEQVLVVGSTELSPTELVRRGYTRVFVRVLDASGRGVSSALVRAVGSGTGAPPAGVSVTPGRTDASGRAAVLVRASCSAMPTSSYPLQLTTAGVDAADQGTLYLQVLSGSSC